MSDDLKINGKVTIPAAELQWTTSRSGGPGGQHVNKTNSKVTLEWNVDESSALSDVKKARIKSRLSNRITSDGLLKISASASRSQKANLEDARERMANLIREAMKVSKPRKKTKPSKRAKRKRLDNKKRRGDLKKSRKKPNKNDY